MECLAEVYDKDPINNLLVILSFRPKKVIIVYDSREADIEQLKYIEHACKPKIPYLIMEYIQVDKKSVDDVYLVCKKIINDNPDCYFDVTGGGEIAAVGTYIACVKTFTPLFKIDINTNMLINVYGCKFLEGKFAVPQVSLDTILCARGASINGQGHTTPPTELYDSILSYCDYIFKDIKIWKELCLYLQLAISKYKSKNGAMFFYAPKNISISPTQSVSLNDYNLLRIAQKLKLINDLKINKENVSFSFRNNIVKKYFADFGTWLELYTYISLKKSRKFHDVRMSVKINWDKSGRVYMEVINEIDVTFFAKSHPIFVSCKLAEPASEALQELSMYPNYFGGQYSKSILVTLAELKDNSHILRRAKDMHIDLIGGTSIKNGTFIEDIENLLGSFNV